jgi:hypothetical protein
MTISTTPARIVSLADGQTYLVGSETYTLHGFDPPPAKAPDTAQLPALYVYTGRGTYDYEYYGDDEVREVREYRIQLAVLPTAEATPELIETRCRAAIAAVRAIYAARPSLGNLVGEQNALLLSDSGAFQLPQYGGAHIGVEFILRVDEMLERIFASNE